MHHKRVPIVESGDFQGQIRAEILPISHSRQLFEVYRMTHESYCAKKQYFPDPAGLWIPYPNFDHIPETKILVAELAGEILGTVTITLDSTRGLPMDQEFTSTCALTRGHGRRLAQVWRLIAKKSSLQDSILTSLVAAAANHLLTHDVQTGLFVVPEEQSETCRDLLNAVTLMRVFSARHLSEACSIVMRAETENLKCLLPVNNKRNSPSLISLSPSTPQ